MTQHTPTPWRAHEWACHAATSITRQCEGPVCYIAECSGLGEHSNIGEANAAFIVRAVNAHDALVAALEDALKLLDQADFKNGNTDSTGSIDEGEVLANRWISEIRAALTLAKGDAT